MKTISASDLNIGQIEHPALDRKRMLLKRCIDLSIASAALALLAPLFVLIAALIKMEGGRVFFAQQRVGQNGRRFRCLKFSSMRADAERQLAHLLASNPKAREEWLLFQKLSEDPRITRFGTVLRKTSLDELPQLLNVLIGDMSIVGPRPIVAPEVSGYANDKEYYYSKEFNCYKSFKPGITGLWQVLGGSRNDYRERVRLDCWYCQNWSLTLDLMILLKTPKVVLSGSGR